MERKTFSIVREGKTYELTSDELREAYHVQQDNVNIDDVVNNIDKTTVLDWYPDASEEECNTITTAVEDETVIEEIACRFYNRCDNDDSWYYTLLDTAKEVLKEVLAESLDKWRESIRQNG